ncbi:transcription termination factor Rho [Candidatus Gottesmanbacteria bacterium CG11_big_fil_rev_8_21_14_0_20_37_11]|uniref:Transcription termination factor Rho n=1 Tax=Candidatus Gottesmanbacteria bacterium CG11_big_fil_rev_8_21_14_0_20_37_11 TaxID=1974575 RepID=A0A2H0NGJ1_9BACT|nr:MAG: transcription termination factor Rho [Candidatus Gottesmanbacteria bacterium CG11_big_fil_rev_8_21_14_0_20_37_11]
MPLKTKFNITKAISVDDVIGAPVNIKTPEKSDIKNDSDQIPLKTVTPVQSSGLTNSVKPVLPPIAPNNATWTQKPSNFTPGLIPANSYPTNGQINNSSDRYLNTPTKAVSGFLDIMQEGHGFLRPKFVPGEGDIYISQSQIRKFQLREGDKVTGQARLPKENERYLGLLKVEKVNDIPADDSLKRVHFEDLTSIYPNKQLKLETEKTPLSTRIIDLLSPIGFGQRGLIVSPPKAGKTTILKEIAHGISENFPKAHLMAVLIGERPEEVTDISRSVKGEVVASNFDEAPEAQTKVAEVALDRARRMVELKYDVIILLDSITRLARAYNLCVNPSGRTLSGGFDPAALYPAKRFLGAARNCEEGGSLTILGTALIETGSRMDDLIYEEFKGTGNMELHLSRYLQEQRVFPAIDIDKSGTRHDELLLQPAVLKKIITLRHMFSLLGEGHERIGTLIDRLAKAKSNKAFLESLNQG